MLKPIHLGKTLIKRSNNYIILFIVTGSLLGLLRFNTIQTGSFFDDAHYIVLAQSIASGSGYKLISYPTAPAENAFPPGWPLLLAPLVGLFPTNFAAMKALSFAFWLLSIPMAVKLFAWRLPAWLQVVFVALIALNPLLIGISGTVMSESAFLFFSLASLLVANAATKQPHRRWLMLTSFALAIYATIIRTIGFTLVITLIIHWLIQQRWEKRTLQRSLLGAMLLGVVVTLLQWSDFKLLSPAYRDHIWYVGRTFVDYLRIWDAAKTISITNIAGAVVPIFNLSIVSRLLGDPVSMIGSGLLLFGMFWGLGLELRKVEPAEIYALLTLGIVYLWFAYIKETQSRQLAPLIPFLAFYFLRSVDWLNRQAFSPKPAFQWLTLAALSAVVALMMALNVYEWRFPMKASTVDLTVSGAWIAKHTPEDAIVMAIDALPIHLYAQRKTVDYPLATAEIKDYLLENSVKFVLIQPNINPLDRTRDLREHFWYTRAVLLPYLESAPAHFRKVYRDEQRNVSIYEVLTLEDFESTQQKIQP